MAQEATATAAMAAMAVLNARVQHTRRLLSDAP